MSYTGPGGSSGNSAGESGGNSDVFGWIAIAAIAFAILSMFAK